MFLVVFASVWKQISYNFLFFFAALQSIPRSLVEAAAIDGAGPIRRFFRLSLPLIAPVSFFLLVVNLVYAFFVHLPGDRRRDRRRAGTSHHDADL